MALDYINEAFKKLDLLEEQMFDTSLDGINKLSDFINNDDSDEVIRVIDPEAKTPDEIQDSYVGKVIVNCNVCHSHVFENKEDIKIEEDGTVNIETVCPYCGEQEGFTIVGEIAPYTSDSQEEEVDAGNESQTDTEEVSNDAEEPANSDDESNVMDESLSELNEECDNADCSEEVSLEDSGENKPLRFSRATRRLMQEEFKEVSVTTDDQHMEMTSDENGKVTIITEPISENDTSEDMIVPVSDETKEEIIVNNDITEEEPTEEIPAEELDFDFEDIDEEGFDELGESYLKRVYENVESFKTTTVAANDTALIVEGLISFTSGTEKKTGFIFEARDVNKKGQLRFSGSNSHLSESKDAFSLVGTIDNKKLFVESLKYNYTVNEEPVRGLVRRK